MLRVAHLTPAYFSDLSVVGGGERYVYYLAHALRQATEIDQTVFSIGATARSFNQEGIPVKVLRNESPSPEPMEGFSSALWTQLKGFDLVHVHQSLSLFGTYSTPIVRSLGIPMVGTDLGGGENALMLQGRGLELFGGILSISRYAHSLVDGYFSGPHEILVGPVDTDRFCPDETIPRDRKTVLCVSRILPHKGIDRVIKALPDGLRLIIAGRVYDQHYYGLLKEMAAGKDVSFEHDADDDRLLRLYRTAGLFIQASTALDIYGRVIGKPELMGLTSLEAMACGLPAAVADTGSLPELVPDPRFGRIFSSHEELVGLLTDYSYGIWPAPGASALACRHVVANHGMAAIGSQLAAFYASLVPEKTATS